MERQEKLRIVGRHCAACATTIERKLRSLRGLWRRRCALPPSRRS